MMPIAHRIILGLLLIALAVLLCLPFMARASERGDWFKSLKQPGTGFGCCDISDCKLTEAEYKHGLWLAVVEDRWRVIPSAAILTDKVGFDNRAVVCAGNSILFAADKSDEMPYIYCFVPPLMGL